jgi:ABC-type antimicrobial peptide transport system permease subunit
MKSVHPPQPIILLILVIVAFVIGALRVFGTAHAATSTMLKVSINSQIITAIDLTPTPVPANTEETDFPSQSTPIPGPASADTTGIIALAIVIVTTILVGATWGVRRSPQKENPRK